MNKAFIFDMDGVIVDSERTWISYESEFHDKLLGKEIRHKMGELVGLSVYGIYDEALKYGFSRPREEFLQWYDNQAKIIYNKAVITEGLDELLSWLNAHSFKIALVSGSPGSWIKMALEKAQLEESFDYILSLHDREDLADKPAPDGYLEAMRQMKVKPHNTFILEDSNRGIMAAKASGAFTIGFRQHLLTDYQQKGADAYAETMGDVIGIVESRFIE